MKKIKIKKYKKIYEDEAKEEIKKYIENFEVFVENKKKRKIKEDSFNLYEKIRKALDVLKKNTPFDWILNKDTIELDKKYYNDIPIFIELKYKFGLYSFSVIERGRKKFYSTKNVHELPDLLNEIFMNYGVEI